MTSYYDKYGRSPDKKKILAIGLPSAAKDTGGYTFTETEFQNKCPKCKRDGTLMWGIFYGGNFRGKGEGGSSEGHIFCDTGLGGCDADFSVQGWEHISGSNSRCKVTKPTKKSSKDKALKLKEGKVPYEGSDTSSNNDSESMGSTIKNALKEVLSGWDGDVECYIREDTCYVHKIPDPTKSSLVLAEGRDVIYDSVKVTDVNPDTINDLTVIWKSTQFHFRDEELIKRFGEVKGEVTLDADSITNEVDAKSMANTEWVKIKRDNGHSVECKTIGKIDWKSGQWVRVYLPSFDIDDYMYLSRCSHNDDGNWTSNLTFVDYPPSLGKPREEESSDESEDSDEEDEV